MGRCLAVLLLLGVVSCGGNYAYSHPPAPLDAQPIIESHGVQCFNALYKYYDGHPMVSMTRLSRDKMYVEIRFRIPLLEAPVDLAHIIRHGMSLWDDLGGNEFVDLFYAAHSLPENAGHLWNQQWVKAGEGFRMRYQDVCDEPIESE